MTFTETNVISTDLASWVDRTVKKNERIIPLYARAVEKADLKELIALRREMAATMTDVDRMIVHCVIQRLEQRIQEDDAVDSNVHNLEWRKRDDG